ncbi:hypothetical protein HYR99_13760 [Candidatus Poribacteria bacterium]|nr:hypothetical protein [Candidatus Poribacteria bacterium]
MLEIRESQIEDIFASQLDEIKNLLSIREDISLVSRQKKLPSGGRLDLLFLSSTHLLLLELKSVRSEKKFCEQVVEYRNDILSLQEKREMPNVPVQAYLACPDFLESHRSFCYDNDVIPIVFSPYELLKNYYFKVKAISNLISLKPSNHGLWNLYLLNRILYSIKEDTTIHDLVSMVELSSSTVRSYLRLSTELGLTIRKPKVNLTELGLQYVKNRETNKLVDYISDTQSKVLSDFISRNPFFSPAIFGIYSAVETVFVLSKNYYPVPLDEARKFFSYLTGKQSEWAEKASREAFIMYSNYGIELGLLAKMERSYYITPAGIRFILLLELNKSILLVDSI